METAYETRDIKKNGTTYRVEFHFDTDTGAPWKEFDGHGAVSSGRRTEKRPGEVRIDSGERNATIRFYDVQATLVFAKRDGWGISDESRAALCEKLGREPTKRQVTAEAVRIDMERMRGWCCDDWHWCTVSVFPLTDDGDELRSKTESLGGIESDAGAYFDEVIDQLISQIN